MAIPEITEEGHSQDGSPPGTADRAHSPLGRLHSPHSPGGISGAVRGGSVSSVGIPAHPPISEMYEIVDKQLKDFIAYDLEASKVKSEMPCGDVIVVEARTFRDRMANDLAGPIKTLKRLVEVIGRHLSVDLTKQYLQAAKTYVNAGASLSRTPLLLRIVSITKVSALTWKRALT